MKRFKCIIIEDQRPAQKILEHYISDLSELELVGLFNNALDATKFLAENHVDLMFLDIHLPKISGIDFLKVTANPPQVIFTTAFPDYALKGYELNALDYLLKPFDFSRFYQAVNKFLNLHKEKKGSASSTENSNSKPYYFAKLDRELIRISFEEITYIQASGDFVNVFFKNKKLFLSESLKHWEQLLKAHGFVKVHKSYIVNIAAVEKVTGNEIQIENDVIPIGRSYRKTFLDSLNA